MRHVPDHLSPCEILSLGAGTCAYPAVPEMMGNSKFRIKYLITHLTADLKHICNCQPLYVVCLL